MYARLRSFTTAGVALVGAGIITVAPTIAPPVPDITVEAKYSSASVQPTAFANPLDAYGQLFQNTAENLQGLFSVLSANPAPILQQIVANQVENVEAFFPELVSTLQSLAYAFSPENPQGVFFMIETAVDLLRAGEIQQAFDVLAMGPVFVIGLPLLMGNLVPAAIDLIGKPLQNLTNVITSFATEPLTLLGLVLAPLNPVMALVGGTGLALQNIVEAAGDPAQLVSALIAAPATILDAALNGYTPDGGLLLGGLLGSGVDGNTGGTIALLHGVRVAIAQVLGYTPNPVSTMMSTHTVSTETPVEIDSLDEGDLVENQSAGSQATAETNDGPAIREAGVQRLAAPTEPTVESGLEADSKSAEDGDTSVSAAEETTGAKEASLTAVESRASLVRDSLRAVPGETVADGAKPREQSGPVRGVRGQLRTTAPSVQNGVAATSAVGERVSTNAKDASGSSTSTATGSNDRGPGDADE